MDMNAIWVRKGSQRKSWTEFSPQSYKFKSTYVWNFLQNKYKFNLFTILHFTSYFKFYKYTQNYIYFKPHFCQPVLKVYIKKKKSNMWLWKMMWNYELKADIKEGKCKFESAWFRKCESDLHECASYCKQQCSILCKTAYSIFGKFFVMFCIVNFVEINIIELNIFKTRKIWLLQNNI